MNTPQPISGERFFSRRSLVMSKNGIVASSHPLATMAGVRVLMQGGNAFDAAVATSAAINVVEPMTNGIGGDMFSLNYVAESQKVTALNGSGRAPLKATLKYFQAHSHTTMPQHGALTVTVPGTVDGWATLLDAHGTLSLAEVLQPAIELASEGFPVSEMMARGWQRAIDNTRDFPNTSKTFAPNGHAPRAGEMFCNSNFAKTLKRIAHEGRDAFYLGEIAEKIARAVQAHDGLLTKEDLAAHTSTWDDAISTDFCGYQVYECPPNGQGIAALLAMNIVKQFDVQAMQHLSADYLHVLIEAMKLAFADAREYVADPRLSDVPINELLSDEYSRQQAAKVDMRHAAQEILPGDPFPRVDTEYHSVIDRWGNACSFICSLYQSGYFGCGIVPDDLGFAIQNRGALFSLDPNHRNVIAPGKRPYHTIIPAMALPDLAGLQDPRGLPYRVISFGVMGGFMQPQGHLQVMTNLAAFNLNAQESLDAPRFQVTNGANVMIEPGVSESVRDELSARGHAVQVTNWWNGTFGRGQVVAIDADSGAILAGSEPRSDGCAIGF